MEKIIAVAFKSECFFHSEQLTEWSTYLFSLSTKILSLNGFLLFFLRYIFQGLSPSYATTLEHWPKVPLEQNYL